MQRRETREGEDDRQILERGSQLFSSLDQESSKVVLRLREFCILAPDMYALFVEAERQHKIANPMIMDAVSHPALARALHDHLCAEVGAPFSPANREANVEGAFLRFGRCAVRRLQEYTVDPRAPQFKNLLGDPGTRDVQLILRALAAEIISYTGVTACFSDIFEYTHLLRELKRLES